MAKSLWESGRVQRVRPSEFSPEPYQEILDGLAEASDLQLEFAREGKLPRPGLPHVPVRLRGRRTGWVVVASRSTEEAHRVLRAAGEIASRAFTTDRDVARLSTEVADRYEELDFVYEMANQVGALLDEDEICAFVAEEAAWRLGCERASVMMADRQTGELKIRAAVGLPEEISSEVSVQPGERISGKVFESGRPTVVNEGDPMPAESLNVEELRESDSFLCVPLKVSGTADREERVLGVINLTRKRRSKMFTASDLKLVSAVAVTTATQIHNCRLINADRERQKLEHELELAARIQLGLLPEKPLSAGPLVVGGCCQPARHVGGDLFDYWVLDGNVFLVMADVAGHDMGAALMAAAVRSVVRSETAHMASVAELLGSVNRALFNDLVRAELFITAFFAQIDVTSGEMTYCRAGHPKPVLFQADQKQWLDTEGMLLGMQEDGQYEQKTVPLKPGDMLVMYTDGVMDAANAQGRMFGPEGVGAVAANSVGIAPVETAHRIVEAAQKHTNEAPQVDDMTTLVAVYGEAAGSA